VAQITLEYPDDLESAVQTTPEEMNAQIRLMAALKMFELGKMSAGRAAELAGLSRVEFLETCGRYRVSVFNYPLEELKAELQADLEVARKASP
jgi:predicted HTH domain antitoxin